MKYTLLINQVKALELGLNVPQALILDLLHHAQSWAEPVVIENCVYFWVSRNQICAELPLLNLKPDTAYRHFKKLDDLGLIHYQKLGRKDCCRLTSVGKQYTIGINKGLGGNSETNPNSPPNSETNPVKLGNEQQKNSEMNPTNKTTKHQTTKNLELFWNEYPKKNARYQVEQWFDEHRPGDALFAEIMDGLRRAKVSQGWRNQFIPDPHSWLNNKRWMDEHNTLPDPSGGNFDNAKRNDDVTDRIAKRKKENEAELHNSTNPEQAQEIMGRIKRNRKR